MRRVLLVFILIACMAGSCPDKLPIDEMVWLDENLYVIASSNNDDYDFSGIEEYIADKRIVAIGESTHGLGEFYRFKSEMVKYLHTELGFEVLALESGIGDINIAWLNRDTLSATELRRNTAFLKFAVREADPLFEHIIRYRDRESALIYTGFDSQLSSRIFLNTFENIISPIDTLLSADMNRYQQYYYAWNNCVNSNDSIGYELYRDSITAITRRSEAVFRLNKAQWLDEGLLSEFEWEVMLKTIEGMDRSTALPWANRRRNIEMRDEVMFDNLQWLIEEVYPDRKFIIWAHNAHLERSPIMGSDYKWMGHQLAEKYKDDYYSIGLFSFKGKAYIHWTQETIAFENSRPDYIEARLSASSRGASFLDLSTLEMYPENEWLWNPLYGREFENGDSVRFIPVQRFDAVINIFESEIPTFDR